MSSKWGREESYRWPSKKPVRTITALFVAALATMATVFYVYAEEWTFLQQRYLGTYITSVSRSWVKVAPYRIVFRVDGAKERLAVDADFNDPVVLARKAKLQWEENAMPAPTWSDGCGRRSTEERRPGNCCLIRRGKSARACWWWDSSLRSRAIKSGGVS